MLVDGQVGDDPANRQGHMNELMKCPGPWVTGRSGHLAVSDMPLATTFKNHFSQGLHLIFVQLLSFSSGRRPSLPQPWAFAVRSG